MAIHEQWPEAAVVLSSGRINRGLETLSEECELASKLSRLSAESRHIILTLTDRMLSLESPFKRFGGS